MKKVFSAFLSVVMIVCTFVVGDLSASSATVPKPKLLSAKANSTSAITIKWKKVKNVKGYVVYCKVKGIPYFEIAKVKASKISYKMKELLPGTKLTFAVKAYKKVGKKTVYSAYSNSKTAKTKTKNTIKKNSQGIGVIKNPTHYATIHIKNYGKIKLALDGNSAPKTVKNFVKLAKSGFYDGLKFHRIIEDFMMQGGDPNGDGTGGSDKKVFGEFDLNGFDNPLPHTKGAISMARAQGMNSATSQFFICHVDCNFLDGSYAVFGYVTEGFDVVDKICKSAKPMDDNGTIKDSKKPVIKKIVITNP